MIAHFSLFVAQLLAIRLFSTIISHRMIEYSWRKLREAMQPWANLHAIECWRDDDICGCSSKATTSFGSTRANPPSRPSEMSSYSSLFYFNARAYVGAHYFATSRKRSKRTTTGWQRSEHVMYVVCSRTCGTRIASDPHMPSDEQNRGTGALYRLSELSQKVKNSSLIWIHSVRQKIRSGLQKLNIRFRRRL